MWVFSCGFFVRDDDQRSQPAVRSSIVVSDQNKNCASVGIINSVGKSLCRDDKQLNHLNILSTSSTEDLPRTAVSTVYDAPVDFKEKKYC